MYPFALPKKSTKVRFVRLSTRSKKCKQLSKRICVFRIPRNTEQLPLADQRQITEVNMSTYVFAGPELLHALDQLKNENRQKEYYLTDCPGILKNEGKRVQALPVLQPCEALSINTADELAQVEAEMRKLGYSQR